ncbi:hypothetical protein J6X15_01375 [Candidatus Saccharibacteria bacterium]|nr:hypothetical protein [Candidatus Saccharibacteria bacterium]
MSKKNILVIVILIIGSIALLGAGLTIFVVSRSSQQASISAKTDEDDEWMKDYTDMLKVYYELETAANELDEIEAMVTEINDKMEVSLGEESGSITMDGTDESVEFTINSDPDPGFRFIEDIVYHDRSNGIDAQIMQSWEYTYQYYNGAVTSEFNTVEEAIEKHLSYRN